MEHSTPTRKQVCVTAAADRNCHNCGMTVDSAVPNLVADNAALRLERDTVRVLLQAEIGERNRLRAQVAELAGALTRVSETLALVIVEPIPEMASTGVILAERDARAALARVTA
tara:strand:- start:16 stop:357 length:342 start_codon:yes stop_codon:yes gene_type:complete